MEDNQGATTDNHQPGLTEQTSPTSSQDTEATASEVSLAMQALLVEIAGLREDFETKVKYDESKERLIESLHRELQIYREGLHFRVLRPVFIDLITLYDDMGKLIDSMPKDSVSIIDQALQNITIFQETVEEILHRNGVDMFTCQGDVFLSSRQRSLRAIPTSDAAQDKYIARRVRKGFEYEGKLLRPEIVETYKYTPSETQ